MILLPAQLEGIRTRKDRTLTLTFGTQELAPAKMGHLLTMNQNVCFLAVKADPFSTEETQLITELKADIELTAKTPAQRLRAVLFRLWEQQGDTEDFPTYYEREMHKITEHFKSKLE
jgi:hypothetical protein